MAHPTGISRALADEMMALRFDQLSPHDINQLKSLVIDFSATALCGAAQPWGRHIAGWAEQFGGRGQSLAIGCSDTMTASVAAMVNGTCGHGFELDDTHEPTRSHPGCVVIAAALAVASERRSSGKAFLSAIAAGYEAMARIGRAAFATGQPARGMHKTATLGHFGAATAAGHLMDLDAATLNRAYGVTLSFVSGTSQFSLEQRGNMTKRLVGGAPAHNGILAAQIASTGLTAPEQALEGEFGFFNMFGIEPDPAKLIRKPGAPPEIMAVSIKPYACCRHFHSVIDALEIATEGFTLDVASIRGIAVHIPPSVVTGKHLVTRPETVMAAQYSMPFIVGATLTHGPYAFGAYDRGHLGDDAILSVIDRTTAVPDGDLAQEAIDSMPAKVVLTLNTGEQRTGKVLSALGSPERPLDAEGMRRKAEALADIVGPGLSPSGLHGAVDALPDATDISLLVSELSRTSQPT